MKLLSLSNGHGEDAIALRILQQLQPHPAHPKLAALPLVGEGYAYIRHSIPLLEPVRQMPSGGFIYMDNRQLARDIRGGLLQLTLAQIKAVRKWARSGGMVLAVGDIVPLLFAWLSGAPYAFVGTAKSDYYLQDEAGLLPRHSWFERLETWSGSVYLPWERWLMSHPRCKAVFPRDTLTTTILKEWNIPAFDLGNPMMDGLEPSGIQFRLDGEVGNDVERSLTFVLLPGSRAPEVYQNWQLILQAVAAIMVQGRSKRLLFLGAIAPHLDVAPLSQALISQGWQQQPSTPDLKFTQRAATLILSQSAYNDCLHQADFAIAMAGTATEQFVGLGKPAITLVGEGPQFTPAFAEAQTRLLGPSAILIKQPEQVVNVIDALLQDPDRLQLIADNGYRRMGAPGAAKRIADHLMELDWQVNRR
ncbi:hypothetical protein IQ268_12765 [Oculatella sp. LEGE 06141]|uniref:lipid-A-disaccharide synthase-related protein n=1 Tax=Oculatella sp. LEGE 06141 TaxID=1828648 RepID=UPI001881F846|nr:lipid-A-disaccharide synthase-related protein [Oculatella sp. LEGE 06141]MBE9179435.1 hypothetical protein [Oculatella sp. LEGE 06141]